ncbi:MAG TPA: VOC family protein [Acidimicrobiales bacterium]|nr:VOC family protein [Acidimicrobiales bacterium]
MPEPGRPRFNHVAMSVPADLLNADGRQAIVAFYSEVFGWQELPTETVDGQKLVLMAYTYDQFVFLIADDQPMAAPRLDHFGMGVATEAELDAFLAKAKEYQARDPRVDIIDKKTEEHPGLRLTSFYVGYLLPLMIEVQLFEFAG